MIRFHHERIRTFGAMMVIMKMDCFGIHLDQFVVVVVVVVCCVFCVLCCVRWNKGENPIINGYGYGKVVIEENEHRADRIYTDRRFIIPTNCTGEKRHMNHNLILL